MKFYEIFSQEDPAASDVFFSTKKEALAYALETYSLEEEYELRVLEHKGPLTKAAVCQMLTNWPQR